jgi:hypothetical protein
VPSNEPVIPLFAKILPVTIIDPLTNTDPVTSRVSALLEYTTLPASPIALKLPVTVNEPVMRTLPVTVNVLPE